MMAMRVRPVRIVTVRKRKRGEIGLGFLVFLVFGFLFLILGVGVDFNREREGDRRSREVHDISLLLGARKHAPPYKEVVFPFLKYPKTTSSNSNILFHIF